ncbi:MAG: DUF6191 domain-containing protein [Propioniciclava sp.]
MSELFEAFAPGMRHWREQRELQKVLVHRTDQGAAGPEPLDLESGRILIDLPTAKTPRFAPPAAGDQG